uniref:hypothetical protein n=1 Tax=uncultured Caulobacter sp. TaxID=158749 RepID=UPI0025D0B4A2|nr:hypothetical protein [uncultured Caulobacter sp.]
MAHGVSAVQSIDGNAIRKIIANMGAQAVIPSNRTRKVPIPHDQVAYKQRNRVERCFNRLKHFRRFATRPPHPSLQRLRVTRRIHDLDGLNVDTP